VRCTQLHASTVEQAGNPIQYLSIEPPTTINLSMRFSEQLHGNYSVRQYSLKGKISLATQRQTKPADKIPLDQAIINKFGHGLRHTKQAFNK
jgi:hypothetical protein